MRARCRCRQICTVVILIAVFGSSAPAEVRHYQDQYGVTWREETMKVQRPVRELDFESREQQVYRMQETTSQQQYQYVTYSPVVQYEWVPRMHDWWRIFQGPSVAYHLEPRVTWQARPYQISYPVKQQQWVAETQTVQVPVARLKMVEKEETVRTAVQTAPPTAPQMAAQPPLIYRPPGDLQQYGGIARMDDGIPRVSTSDRWHPIR